MVVALFLNDLHTDLNLPDLPVVIIQSHCGEGDSVLQVAQANVAAALPATEMVISEDLSGYYHFDSAAHLVIGKRGAEAIVLPSARW